MNYYKSVYGDYSDSDFLLAFVAILGRGWYSQHVCIILLLLL